MFLVISDLKNWVTQNNKLTQVEVSLNISCCLFGTARVPGPIIWNVDVT